ncbi:LacI family DNA-binding transcriptional regulator [Propionicimonas sp.]|uniref:LacI family DNA-binding transcriptional regulator n=1 Tax=Propionicimonas sp. TaxID=1955623 RepID=UPI0039E70BEB
MGAGTAAPVTMKTLAEDLGVSVTTVSNAYSKPDRLSEELREQILARAQEIGYCGPSAAGRALRSGRTDVCGFLFGGEVSRAFSDPYSVIFLSGLSEALEEHGASVLLLRASGAQEAENQLLQRAAIDAIVVGSTLGAHPGLDVLRRRGIRIVGTHAGEDGDWVAINDAKAGRLVGKHLTRLGHQRVVVLAPSRSVQQGEEAEADVDAVIDGRVPVYSGFVTERLRGLREKLPGARITVVCTDHNTREAGRSAGAHALDVQGGPSAIVALSDVLAVGVWDAVTERGLTPGRDLSIVGFDDIPDAGFLGITTVHQPIAEKGRLAGRLAMDPDRSERQITLPVELVVRTSTGPAPRN